MDDKKRKEELLKELADIEAQEKNPEYIKKQKKKKRIIISSVIITLLLVSSIGIGLFMFNNNQSSTSNETTTESSSYELQNKDFIASDKKAEEAKKWLKDKKYSYTLKDDTLKIDLYDNDKNIVSEDLMCALSVSFSVEKVKDKNYKLTDPKYILNLGMPVEGNRPEQVVFKADSSDINVYVSSYLSEVKIDKKLKDKFSDKNIEKLWMLNIPMTQNNLKIIADSKDISINLYDDETQSILYSNNNQQTESLKRQIKVADTFYSLNNKTIVLDEEK